ncbi:MAG: hypothetical protein M0011_15260 [Elusimicrobia bacterium]|nr:hypothetical protein [Elusimicrobiota bacterium]
MRYPALPLSSLLAFSPVTVHAGGACCSVAKAGGDRLTITVVGAAAANHERLEGAAYEVRQQAVLLKAARPMGKGFSLQAQLGRPTYTKLSHQGMRQTGRGGLIYGGALAYKPPFSLGRTDFFISLGHSRSSGSIQRDGSAPVDRSFRITEWQALFMAETPLTAKASLYAGLRAYSARNRLAGAALSGEPEGNLGGVAGLRYGADEGLGLIADAGFGHTKVLGAGVSFSF